MNTSVKSKNRRFTALAWILAAMVLIVAIPLNLIFGRINFTYDMTPNSMYTLSKTTTNYLDELDQKGIVVDVYYLDNFSNLENNLETLALYRTLLAYKEHKCFNLQSFDPDVEPAKLRALNPDGVFNLSRGDFLFVYNGMTKRLPGELTYVFKVDENDRVVSADFRAENYFTGYIKTVVDGELPVLYFLEGHGEVPLTEMSLLKSNLGNNNYGARPLNLMTADAVPDDCRILVIASPEYDLEDDEYDKILAYTKTGGNVSVFMNPNDAKTTYPNLERLLASYCVGMRYDRITETDENRRSRGETYAMMCDINEQTDSSKEDLTSMLLPENNDLETFMPYSRSFYNIYGANFSSIDTDAMIKTAVTAQSEPWGGTSKDPETITGQELALAMYAKDPDRNDSKLTVFGSSDFITDTGSKNVYFVNPLTLFQATITWMYNSDVDMNIPNKERTYDSLNINSASEASSMIALFIGFPVLIAAIGVVVWLRRKDA